jgi:chromosome segregation ATPase
VLYGQAKSAEEQQRQEVTILELQRQVSEIQSQNDMIQAILTKVESEADERAREMQTRLDEANFASDEKQRILDKATQLVKSQEEEISLLDAQKLSVNEELEELRMELNMSRSMVQGMESHIVELETDKANVAKDLQTAQLEASESNVRIVQAIRDKDEEIYALQTSLERERASTLHLTKALQETNTVVETEVKDLKSKNDLLSLRNTELASSFEKANIEARELQENLDAAGKEIATRDGKCERLDCELQDARSQIEKDNQRHCSDLEEKERKFAKYKSECDSGVQSLMFDLQERSIFIRNLEATKTTLSSQVEELLGERDSLRTEKARLQEELDCMSANLFEAKNEAAELHDQMLQQLENGESQAHMEVERKEEELFQVIESLREANDTIGALKSELDKTRGEVLSATETVEGLQEERDDLQHRCDQLEARDNEREQAIVRLTDEKVTAESRYEKTQSEILRLESEVSTLQTSKQELEQQVLVREASRSVQFAHGSSKIESLERLLEEKSAGLVTALDRLNVLEAKHLKSLKRATCIEMELRKSNKDAGRVKIEMSNLKLQLQAMKGAIKGLERQLQFLLHEKDEAQARGKEKMASLSEQLQRKSAELEATIASKNAMEEETTKALIRLQVEKADFESQLFGSNERVVGLENHIADLQSSKLSIEKERDQLLQTKSDLLTQSSDQVQTMQSQLDQTIQKLAVVTETLEDLKEELDVNIASRHQYKSECNSLRYTLSEAEVKISFLQDNIEILEASNTSLKGDLRVGAEMQNKSRDKIEALHSQLESTLEDISACHGAIEALEMDKQKLVVELDVMAAKAAANESACTQASSRMADMDRHICDITSGRDELKCQIEELQKSNAQSLEDSSQKMALLESTTCAKVKELELEKQNLKVLGEDHLAVVQERNELEAKLSEATTRLSSALEALSSLDSSIGLLEATKIALEEKLSSTERHAIEYQIEATQEIESLASRVERYACELKAAEDVTSRAKEERDALMTKLEEDQPRLAEVLGQVSTLENELSSLQSLKSAREAELTAHTAKIVDLEHQTTIASADFERLESELRATQLRLNSALEEMSRREEETMSYKNSLSEELSSSRSANEAVELRLKMCTERLSISRSEVKALESAKESIEKERDLLRSHNLQTGFGYFLARRRIPMLEQQIEHSEGTVETLNDYFKRLVASKLQESDRLEGTIVSLESQLEATTMQLSSRVGAVESLEANRQALMSQTKVLESKVTAAESESVINLETISNLERSVASLNSELEATRDQFSALEHDLIASGKEKDDIEARLTETEFKLCAARNTISSLQDSLSILESEKEALNHSIVSLRSEKVTKANQLASYRASVASLEDEKIVLGQKLAMMENELSTAAETISTLEGSIESEVSDKAILIERVTALESSISRTSGELSSAIASVASLEEDKHDLAKEKDFLEFKFVNLEVELSTASQQIAALESANKTLRCQGLQREELQQKIDSLESELRGNSDYLSSAATTITCLEDERDALRRKVATLDSDLFSASKRIATLEDVTASLESKVSHDDTLRERLISLESDIKAKSGQLKSASAGVASLSQEKHALTAEISRLEAVLKNTEFELSTATDTISTLEASLSGLESDVSERDELKEKLSVTRGELSQSRDTHNLLEMKIAAMESSALDLEDKLSSLRQSTSDEHSRLLQQMSLLERQLEIKAEEVTSGVTAMALMEAEQERTLLRCQEYETNMLSSQAEVEWAKSLILSLNRDITSLEKSNSIIRASLDSQIKQASDAKALDQAQIETLESRVELLGGEVLSGKNALIRLEIMHSSTLSELGLCRDQILGLESQLSCAKSDLLTAQTTIVQMDTSKSLVETSHSDQASKLQWVETERKALVIRMIDVSLWLSCARSQVAQLTTQMGLLEASSHATEAEKDSLCKAIKENEDLLASSAQQLEYQVLNGRRLEEELNHKIETLDASNEALETLRSQNAKLFNDLAATKDQAAAECLAMDSQINRLKAEAAFAKEENGHLKERNVSLTTQLRENQEQILSCHRDSDHLKAEILKQDRYAKASHMKHEEEVVVLTKTLSDLHSLVEVEREENKRLTTQTESLTHKISELELSRAESKATIEKQQAQLEETAALLALQKRDVQILQDSCSALKDDCVRLQEKADESEKTHAAQLAAHELNHRMVLDREEERTHQLSRSLASVKSGNEELTESLSCARQEVDDSNRQLQELMNEYASKVSDTKKSHATDLDRLAMEIADLKKMLEETKEAGKQLRHVINKKDELLLAEQNTRDALLKDKETFSKALHEAEDVISELRCELLILHEEGNESSDDSEDSELNHLTKAELKVECMCLHEELLEAETRATQSKNEGSKYARRAKGLEADLVAISSEMDLVLQTNRNLDQRIVALLAEKASSEAASAMVTSAHREVEQQMSLKLRKCLVEQSLLSVHIARLQDKIAKSSTEFDRRRKEIEDDLTQLRRPLMMLKAECAASRAQIHLQSKEIVCLSDQRTAARARSEELETQVSEIQQDSTALQEALQACLKEAEQKIERRSSLLNDQHSDESSQVREKFEEVSRKIEGMRSTLQSKDAEIENLTDNLDKKHEYARRMDALRELAVGKLSDASKAIVAQREEAVMLRSRLEQEEKAAAILSKEVGRLLDSRDLVDQKYHAKLEVWQHKHRQLLEERDSSKGQVEEKQEDLRQTNRRSAQLERINESLQERVHEMKKNLADVKGQLRQACDAYEESASSCRKLEKDLADKRVQIDHCKAKIQVLEATISRLNSDVVLHEPSVVVDTKVASNAVKEVKHLRTEMKVVTTHLSSVASALQYEKKAASEMRMSEETLVNFIGEVINFATGAQREIMARTLILQRLEQGMSPSRLLLALDLPGMVATPDASIWEVRSCLNKLESLVTKALKELHVKRTEFNQWKDRHSRPAPTPITPTFANSQLLPITPSHDQHRDKFGRIKMVLHESMTESGSMHLGPERVRMIERLMGNLLEDLQATDAALLDKNKLFTEMENLVSQQDSERLMLEKRIERLDSENREFEKRIEEEASLKKSVERELISLRNAAYTKRPVTVVSMGGLDSASRATAKVAAARLMCSVLDRKAKAEAAAAFRKWSCAASAMTAVHNQKEAAVALAQQLEMTREKLFVLKNHLKLGRHSQSGESVRKPRLRRLLDRLDKRDKREPGVGEGEQRAAF